MIPTQQKIVTDWARLGEVVEQARQTAQRVVFTNGCFDLLHVGHIHVLEQARAAGDLLIVALNSDESVRQLKGDNRPILPLEDRLEIVAACEAVSWVTSFNEPTPINLIKQLQPNVLVKGGDWSPEAIVGAEVVLANGGEVISVPLIKDKSTTALIGRSGHDEPTI